MQIESTMMKSSNCKILFFVFIVMLLGLESCNKSISNIKEYMSYMSDKDNGLVKEKFVGGLSIKVKYLPTEYLIYNSFKTDLDKLNLTELDERRNEYGNSMTFLMTLGPQDGKSFDITKVGVANYEEFADRIVEMNFNMGSNIKLKVSDKIYKPKLTQMESLYGLKKERDFLVVFEANNEEGIDLKEDDMYFIYHDNLFNTGINKFKFLSDDFKNIPEFEFGVNKSTII